MGGLTFSEEGMGDGMREEGWRGGAGGGKRGGYDWYVKCMKIFLIKKKVFEDD